MPHFTTLKGAWPLRWISVGIAAAALLLLAAHGPFMPPPPPGLTRAEAMGPYLNGVFPDTPPTGNGPGAYELENAFPNLTFIDPLKILEVPGQNKMMVLGKNGQVWVFDNNPQTNQKQLILDITSRTLIEGDGGALGLAIHPEFGQPGSPNRGYIYLWYRYAPVLYNITGPAPQWGEQYGYLRLSRFTLEDGNNVIDPLSEYVLIQQFDRNAWHNGGDMFFGPDGFLYVSVGDEGSADDGYDVSQRLNYCLFGGILRIDVDQRGGSISHPIRRQPQTQIAPPAGWPLSQTQGYYIPNDNPWQDENGGILEEFYAIGLRSPHRMSWDSLSGDIWVGDVGQGTREEVAVVSKGDNHQWPFREGRADGPRPVPGSLTGLSKAPIYDYPRDMGTCIIGGYRYKGSKFPDLYGRYIFGDHTTLNVFTLTPENDGSVTVNPMLNVPYGTGQGDKAGISSFGEDQEGNVYILKLNGTGLDGGIIYKIKPKAPVADPPAKLSDLGVFSDLETLTPVPGIIPYDVNSPLWSDRAEKYRWVALPNDGDFDDPWEKVGFRREDYWTFPAGTVFIKHFELPLDENNPGNARRLETRFFVLVQDGAYGLTYKWNDEGTEAFLLTDADTLTQQVTRADGSTFAQTWDFPSRQQCMTCHNENAGFVLGLKTRQLNRDLTYPTGITGNQLETWAHLGIFNQEIGDPAQLPSAAPVSDPKSAAAFRIRSYIDANCSFCHRPDGVEGAFDGRALTALYDQNLIWGAAISHASGGGRIVVPGDVGASILFQRDNSTSANAMPPIAKNLVDDSYISLLQTWIDELAQDGPAVVPSDWYLVQARHSGQVITIPDAADEAGTEAVQQLPVSANHQQFQLQEMGGGKYRLLAAHSLLVLAPADLRTTEGGTVTQQRWSGSQHQFWYLKPAPDGHYLIINAYSQLALDVFGGQNTPNARLITWTENGATNQQWKLMEAPGPDCGFMQVEYLSDLDWIGTPENGWGPVEKNRSNGELGATDGNPLTIRGKRYAKGLGVHSYSRLEYALEAGYDRFVSEVGLDDETWGGGSVEFRVWGDGELLYSSGVVYGNQPILEVDVPIRGVERLVLEVLDAGDGNGLDHANWADARLVSCEPAIAPPVVTVSPNPTDASGTVWVEFLQPERQSVQLALFDIQGRVVFQSALPGKNRQVRFPLEMQGLAAGVYLLRLSGENWSETKRVLVR